MEKLYTSKAFLNMAGGKMRTSHLIPPVSTPSHKLQKLSKKPDIFQSLDTINFVLLTKRGGGQCPVSSRRAAEQYLPVWRAVICQFHSELSE